MSTHTSIKVIIPEAGKPRFAEPAHYSKRRARVGAGILLAHVSDDEIVDMIDGGMTAVEVAKNFKVGLHVARYRVQLLRTAGRLPPHADGASNGRFFIDYVVLYPYSIDQGTTFFMIPSHRRKEWNEVACDVGIGDPAPKWAIQISDPAGFEFSKPHNISSRQDSAND